MNRKELHQRHWRYYRMLEKRFIETIEYVELNEDNTIIQGRVLKYKKSLGGKNE